LSTCGLNLERILKGKGEGVLVTGCGGPWGCEMSRLPQFLDSWLTDDGEVVSLTFWLLFTPRKIPSFKFFKMTS
jgi:hypothetical protein